MVPRLVCSLTIFSLLSVVSFSPRRAEPLSRSFVQDLPAATFLDPVLPLSHFVGQIVARIVLQEADHGQIVPPRVEKHRNRRQAHLDPLFARVHPALLR